MAWYDTGTVSVTNGSTAVVGSGTNFISGAQIGEAFYGPDGRLYEIQTIVSATSLTLADPYLGSTQSGQVYKIVPTQSLVATLAAEVSELITDFQTVKDEAGAGKFQDGTAALPAITFNLDQDTGFSRPAANQIGFSTAGVQRALLTSTGLNDVVIGATTAAAGTFTTATATTLNATTVDTTNLEVTNLKAKDGTAAATIADATGVMTVASSVLTTTDINGGTVDGTTIGATTPSTIAGTTGSFSGDLTIADKIVHSGDTNTAIRFPAADTVTIETGGAERMRVDSSGNVGIGTSDPTTLGGGSKFVVNQGADGNIVFARGGSTRQVQLGTSSTMGYINADNASGGLGFNVNATERARIDSDGNLLVGTTSPSATNSTEGFRVIAGGVPTVQRGAGGNFSVFYNSANSAQIGSISNNGGTATSYNTSSDYRLKENVEPMQNALDTVAQLNPVTYTWKADGSAGQGFIAHELQAVVPDCVTGEKDAVDKDGNPQYQGVDTSFLVATLVKAIQEQQDIITALTARIEALENTQ
jgi:hypothetical protein